MKKPKNLRECFYFDDHNSIQDEVFDIVKIGCNNTSRYTIPLYMRFARSIVNMTGQVIAS